MEELEFGFGLATAHQSSFLNNLERERKHLIYNLPNENKKSEENIQQMHREAIKRKKKTIICFFGIYSCHS